MTDTPENAPANVSANDTEIAIGTRLWLFSENRRVYAKNAKDEYAGGPIYSEHFQECFVTGETKGCWIVGNHKVNKRTFRTAAGAYGGSQFYTDAGKADNVWANDHRYKIGQRIISCPVAQLRQIAAIIGYEAPND